MSANEAKDYGIVDHVITHRGEVVPESVIAAAAAAR
jgi:ATP-dependent protease ClpP protease subunit